MKKYQIIIAQVVFAVCFMLLVFRYLLLEMNYPILDMSLRTELSIRARHVANNDFQKKQIRYYEIKQDNSTDNKITSDTPHRFEGKIPVYYYYYRTFGFEKWFPTSRRDLANYYVERYNISMRNCIQYPGMTNKIKSEQSENNQ